MKTAVEWYAEQEVKLTLDFLAKKISELEYGLLSLELLNQAKEMEKEQKIDFARLCLNKAKDLDILTSFMNAEQYYNVTFKSE
jgi:hypothetical protein